MMNAILCQCLVLRWIKPFYTYVAERGYAISREVETETKQTYKFWHSLDISKVWVESLRENSGVHEVCKRKYLGWLGC